MIVQAWVGAELQLPPALSKGKQLFDQLQVKIKLTRVGVGSEIARAVENDPTGSEDPG